MSEGETCIGISVRCVLKEVKTGVLETGVVRNRDVVGCWCIEVKSRWGMKETW